MKFLPTMTTVISALALTACAYHPTHYQLEQQALADFTAESLPINARLATQPQQQWWQQFNDPTLMQLMQQLEQNNFDISIAQKRVAQSKALLGVQRSANWPQLDGAINASDSKNHQTEISQSSTDAVFTAAYEVDLWGQRDARVHSAEYALFLEQQQLNSLKLQVRAMLAQQYFDALSLHEKIQLTEKNLKATDKLYQLIVKRFELGGASQIQVDQQHNILLGLQTDLASQQQDYAIRQHAIAVLLGTHHIDGNQLAKPISDVAIPEVAVVQPATMMQSRPDIRIAELALRISDADLYATKTKRWPGLNLTAQASLVDVFDGSDPSTSLLGSLAAPIFNGGRISNEIEAAEIETSVQLDRYQQTVLQAMQEALDVLTRMTYQRTIYTISDKALSNNERLYARSQQQYESGAIDFLNLLEAQRTLFDSREARVNAKQQYLAAIVDTYRAMGNAPLT